MANTGSIVRKNLRDLSNSMEMRELNRQLDWIWKKILGGLTAKDFSDGGMKSVVEVIEKTVAEEITADEITTNILKVALAQMMVAEIGVAKISYAQIVDLFSDNLFTDVGLAGEFRMNKLQVTQAQIVDMIVSSFRIVASDGKVYKVTVDKNGNLLTERVADQDSVFANGKIPDGYSAVASSLTVGSVAAGKLYVSGSAEVMKLTAKMLIADNAWINQLVTNTALVDRIWANEGFIEHLQTADISNNSSISIIAGNAADALEKANAANSTADKASDTADAAAVTATDAMDKADVAQTSADNAVLAAENAAELAKNAVSKPEFSRVVRIDLKGLHVGDNLASCEVLIDSASVNVVLNGRVFSSFAANYAQFGDYQMRRSADGGIVFKMR